MQPDRSSPVQGASFWVRTVAHGLDLIFVMILAMPIYVAFLLHGVTPMWIELPLNVLLFAGVITLWRYAQTTPGKRIFQLRIVDSKTGGRPSWWKLAVRYFAYLIAFLPWIPLNLLVRLNPDLFADPISRQVMEPYIGSWLGWFAGFPLGFGYFWILVDRRNRGWHDLLSGTVTVSKDLG